MASGGGGGGGGGGRGVDPTVTTISELHRLIFIIIQDYKTIVDNKDQDDMVTMSMIGGRVSTENL